MLNANRLFGGIEYKYLVAIAFVSGIFMDILDTTIVNAALPRLSEDFHANVASLEWVVTGYLLSLAVWIPASGWIGDRFGTKRTFLFANGMFIAGSALCGAAWSIESLTLFRVLQGVGGGMLTPVGMAMLYRAFTPQERARASAILSIPTTMAPMLGPVLGGWLIDQFSWRWIFYVNVPVGILSLWFSAGCLREHREATAGKFDPAGFLLSGVAIAGVLYALSRGVDDGWTSPRVLISGLGGLLSLVLLIAVELRLPTPMLDLRLYDLRMFRVSSLVAFMSFSSQFGMLFLLPLFLQVPRGLSALDSGLTTLPQPVGQVLMIQVTSRLYNRIGPRRNLIVSTSGLAITSGLFLLVGLETDLWLIRGLMLLRGMFIAFQMVAMQTAAFSAVPRPKTGRASSLLSTMRQIAAAFGVAVAATVLVSGTSALAGASGSGMAQPGAVAAFHTAFAVASVFGLLGLLFALRIRDHDVAPAVRLAAQAA
ncbi:MAG TPA: MDR family MFS transporter [Chloroflexota bacterium]|nr:MDR family MFS transporter [Chloroflexota bacterium]